MPQGKLGAYLNDHLAGSLGAIEMLERAVEHHADSALGPPLAELLAAIREDQGQLRRLIERIGAGENPLKKAGAWLAERAGRLKLGGSGDAADFGRLEMLETLGLGIQGKRQLWRALRAVAQRYPEIQSLDLDRLERRAQEQYALVERWRIEAAESAL